MTLRFRLLDFHSCDKQLLEQEEDDDDDDEDYFSRSTPTHFLVQMFGITMEGETTVLFINDFNPHFFVKIDLSTFNEKKFISKLECELKLKKKGTDFNKNKCKIVKRKKLYGFDDNTFHDFLYLEFNTIGAFHCAKNLWYEKDKLLPLGFQNTFLYESQIPPLLRFFHINNISPSGWVEIEREFLITSSKENQTYCHSEYTVKSSKHIKPLNGCDDMAKYKICSFDIEASSSHGDFPVPIKSYKKLAINIVDYFGKRNESVKDVLPQLIKSAFGYIAGMSEIDIVYPKEDIALERLEEQIMKLSTEAFLEKSATGNEEARKIEYYFTKLVEEEKEGDDEEEEDNGKIGEDEKPNKKRARGSTSDDIVNLIEVLSSSSVPRDIKIQKTTVALDMFLPPLKGDETTFIGSTFLRFGDDEPYLNHCIVLGSCSDPHLPKTEFEMLPTERDVLLAWTQLIQRENPDIIIGYNIFGFDYKFLYCRAQENHCLEPFLKLSRNKDEVCCRHPYDGSFKLDETKTVLASGEHELHYIRMTGRVQIDLYNYFRKEENLPSYKLDYVAGHFIGGWIDALDMNGDDITTVFCCKMSGLVVDSFVHFELVGHTTEYLNDGCKYRVLQKNEEDGYFQVEGNVFKEKSLGKLRWCLAKDDVSPQDIFRMSKESDESRYIIGKYCLQDCNLLHYLMKKVDIMTGFVEMASICSVPISFLVFRGQGIKLTSYVAKKCRLMNTLMAVLDKVENDDGYEGATVLDPKCNLYLDTPVACVDYASLYPSSMISENLSQDSKVWTREYNLEGDLMVMTGSERYDNLPGYEYVDIQYDTYKYVRKTKTAHAEKVKTGYKICRFAQYPDGKKAIMPMILQDLLKARKDTRALIKKEKDDFMKNVLDKRQLGYKVTANSLYGQCGAKTSTFFDKDIAASTTATGRSLLIYAKTIIETVYANRICRTKFGDVRSNAEYIYGDTDSVFFTFHLETLEGVPIKGKEALEITIELAQEAGHLATAFLKAPHDLEYEKTFMPFCLLSKKRYVGILYETDITKGKRKEMGIVLKRRDNAPIVKDIYGGIIDILMKEKDIEKAVEFLKSHLNQIVEEKCPMEKLIITKSLRSGYKNPQQIAHKVLADRITARDPGNKPSSGDRIAFVYISQSSKGALQGERIETPAFILEKKLKIDYSFYITNQIMKPIQQLFSLVLDQLWISAKKHAKKKKFELEINTLKKSLLDPKKIADKIDQARNKEVKELLFDPYLRVTENQKKSQKMITSFF
jgi:DNA polymerase elongation subunit (family B)